MISYGFYYGMFVMTISFLVVLIVKGVDYGTIIAAFLSMALCGSVEFMYNSYKREKGIKIK